jgi:hypothetical protein
VLIEQIRYYFREDDRTAVLDARRLESRIRESLGIGAGMILVPDSGPTDEPCIVWQSGYADEGEMANSEQALLGSEEYHAARDTLAKLATRLDLELFVVDESSGADA